MAQVGGGGGSGGGGKGRSKEQAFKLALQAAAREKKNLWRDERACETKTILECSRIAAR